MCALRCFWILLESAIHRINLHLESWSRSPDHQAKVCHEVADHFFKSTCIWTIDAILCMDRWWISSCECERLCSNKVHRKDRPYSRGWTYVSRYMDGRSGPSQDWTANTSTQKSSSYPVSPSHSKPRHYNERVPESPRQPRQHDVRANSRPTDTR